MTSSIIPADTKVLVIVGPTASGKSSFGIRCCEKYGGEIISSDSIQVYKGLDIGSAKVSKEEQERIPHHLIDILDPKENYSVREFQQLSRGKIMEISRKGKLPVLLGGTGLYVKAALYDYVFYEEEEEDDPFSDLSNQEIYDLLMQKDPACLEKIHINNRKRLVRALNVCLKHNIGISEIAKAQEHKPLFDIYVAGLTCSRQQLHQRIDDRVNEMVKNGLMKEIDKLLSSGVSFDDQSMQGIGYKEWKDYYSGEKKKEDVIALIKHNTWKFAKRQYTWFRNQMDVHWFTDENEALKEIDKWLNI